MDRTRAGNNARVSRRWRLPGASL